MLRGTIAPQWSDICIGSSGIPGYRKNDNSQCGKEWVTGHQTDVKYLVIPLNSCQSQTLTKSDTPEGDTLCCLLIFTEASQQEAYLGNPGSCNLYLFRQV